MSEEPGGMADEFVRALSTLELVTLRHEAVKYNDKPLQAQLDAEIKRRATQGGTA